MVFCANVHLHVHEMENSEYGQYIHCVISQLEKIVPSLNDIIDIIESQRNDEFNDDTNGTMEFRQSSLTKRIKSYLEGGSVPGP